MIMRTLNFVYLLLIMFLLISCNSTKKEKMNIDQSDYSFRIPGIEVYLTTSKRKDAKFYVMFSKDSLAALSDSIDYLKFETAEMSDIGIIFDPRLKNEIYIRNTEYLDEVHSVNYNLNVIKNRIGLLSESKFDSLFFEPKINTEPPILKYPYINIGIITSSYKIYLKKYEISYKRIKEGNINGGW